MIWSVNQKPQQENKEKANGCLKNVLLYAVSQDDTLEDALLHQQASVAFLAHRLHLWIMGRGLVGDLLVERHDDLPSV